MICSDSMHSKLKVNEKYPTLNEDMVQKLYGVRVSDAEHHMWETRQSAPEFFIYLRNTFEKKYNDLNLINLTEFYTETSPNYFMIHCHMQGKWVFLDFYLCSSGL